MKVLVTGGSGFLGRRLVARLLDRGMSVRCLVRRAASLETVGAAGGDLEVREGDIGRVDADSDILDGCDVVYHLASGLRGGTAGMFLTNVVAVRGLLAAAARPGIRRFVLVSSLGVYGTAGLSRGGALDESCPLDPAPQLRDPYSFSRKVAQEEGGPREEHRRGAVRLVVVRPGVIFGPGREAITGRVGLRLGDFLLQMGGRHRLPYTYVDNCADAVLLAGIVPGVEGEAFNIVDDELPTGRQISRMHRRRVGRLRTLTIPRPAIRPLSHLCEWYHRSSRGQLPAVLTPYKSEAQWKPLSYPNAKAKSRLGWAPAIDLEEGLRRTFDSLATERDKDVSGDRAGGT